MRINKADKNNMTLRSPEKTKDSSGIFNIIETARSCAISNNKASAMENDLLEVEKARGAFTNRLEKANENKLNYYDTDKDIVNINNQVDGLKLEKASGVNCCANLNKRCIIF